MRRRPAALLGGAAMIVALAAPAAGAWPFAPELVDSTPLDEERLHSAPTEVLLEFSQEIDGATSTIEVLNECGKRVDDEAVEVSGTTLSTELKGDFKGTYSVRYEATGFGTYSGTATDELTFTVRLGEACGAVQGHHHGGSGSPPGNSDNQRDARDHSRRSSPSGDRRHRSSSTSSSTGSTSSTNSSDSSANTVDSTGPFDNGSTNVPPLAAPTPIVTPTPLPTLTPAPAPTTEEPDQELTLTASPQPAAPADGADVLISLSLVVLLGVLGGWVLRASAPR